MNTHMALYVGWCVCCMNAGQHRPYDDTTSVFVWCAVCYFPIPLTPPLSHLSSHTSPLSLSSHTSPLTPLLSHLSSHWLSVSPLSLSSQCFLAVSPLSLSSQSLLSVSPLSISSQSLLSVSPLSLSSQYLLSVSGPSRCEPLGTSGVHCVGTTIPVTRSGLED